jgi:pimeloyl-ACP methyl ester carboxylesterase
MTTTTVEFIDNAAAPSPVWAKQANVNFINSAGINMRYLKMGQGKPLVLVHTLRTQLDYFMKLIPELAKHYTVYAIDLPGHGHSDITNQTHDKPLFIKHVSEFIKELNLTNVTLVGESVGASISLSIAAQAKVSIKQVFALNPADYDNSNGLDRSSILGKILFTGIKIPFIGWIISNAEKRDVLQQVLEGGFEDNKNLPSHLVDDFSKTGERKGFNKAFRSIFLNWKSWSEDKKQYRKIDVPVTLIYAEHDWSTLSERRDNLKLIDNAKLITIKNCGHFSSLDNPKQVLNTILTGTATN